MNSSLEDSIDNAAQISALELSLKAGFTLFDKVVLNNNTWEYIYSQYYDKKTDDEISKHNHLYGKPILIDKYLEDGRMVFCDGDDIVFSIKINMQD